MNTKKIVKKVAKAATKNPTTAIAITGGTVVTAGGLGALISSLTYKRRLKKAAKAASEEVVEEIRKIFDEEPVEVKTEE